MVFGVELLIVFEEFIDDVFSTDTEPEVFTRRAVLLELPAVFVNIYLPAQLLRFADQQRLQLFGHLAPPQIEAQNSPSFIQRAKVCTVIRTVSGTPVVNSHR